MLKTQEPKYDCTPAGKLYNRESGELIPDDEPIMVFRAKDRHAAEAIAHYIGTCENAEHRRVVQQRYSDFINFADARPDRMHEPD